MSTQTLPAPVAAPSDVDNLVHICCPCTPLLSLCGVQFATDSPEIPWDEYDNDCIVCQDWRGGVCPRCGGLIQ